MPTGAELFVRACVQLGLDPIFTLVGDHLNEVLAAAARAGMRVVDMRHESAVTHAADAWARIHPSMQNMKQFILSRSGRPSGSLLGA